MSYSLDSMIKLLPKDKLIKVEKIPFGGKKRFSFSTEKVQELYKIGKSQSDIFYIGYLQDEDFLIFQKRLEEFCDCAKIQYCYRILKYNDDMMAVLSLPNNKLSKLFSQEVVENCNIEIIPDVPYSVDDEFPMYNGINIFTVKSFKKE